MNVDTVLKNIITLKNVSQSYDDGKTFILKDVSLNIEDKPNIGQFVILMGKSGCGKSTILRYIAGLQKPTSGEVLVHEKPLTEDRRVSMVFQQYSSMPWYTVYENIELPLKFKNIAEKERKEKVNEMIKFVGLQGQENKYAVYPTLSGGQLQRVAIARSLIASPEILLMDEPFGALDVNTRMQMQDLLLNIWRTYETTIFFITHDIAEAVYLGDDILIMSSNPGTIKYHFQPNLPHAKTKDIKHDAEYINMVQKIEDVMMTL